MAARRVALRARGAPHVPFEVPASNERRQHLLFEGRRLAIDQEFERGEWPGREAAARSYSRVAATQKSTFENVPM